MGIFISHYPRPFLRVFSLLHKDPGGNLRNLYKVVDIDKLIGIEIPPLWSLVETNKIGANPLWITAQVGPCFFIGAAVKDKNGIVKRAVAGHISARFEDSDLKAVANLSPVEPDETINVFIAGSSQRTSGNRVIDDVNRIVNKFTSIGLLLKVDTTSWQTPVITDVKNNIVVSDLGNKENEAGLARTIYFGVSEKDCMLFCIPFWTYYRQSGSIIVFPSVTESRPARIITSDRGLINF